MNESLTKVFSFEGSSIRVVVGEDGEPWWVASDVAAVLGYRDASTATRILPDDEKGTHQVCTPGGKQNAIAVSEPGLYRLILRSDRPEAEAFRRWITHEVLPSIRKTGGYGTRPIDLRDPTQLAPLALQLAELVQEQQKQLAEAQPKVEFFDNFAEAKGRYGLQNAARVLGLPPNKWIRQLQDDGYLFRQGRALVPREEYLAGKLFEVKVVLVDGATYHQTFVTPAGMEHFAAVYSANKPLALVRPGKTPVPVGWSEKR